ncbi:MAG: hypothetical protein DRR06_05905 [Gammaproteobacteria bacterium]|nr:MAG: hypothetical protein DRR06_05905 [Gammaproteobacteria bacterium]RLA53684.1 MAG: hypothetical protein DRR42_04035 [Gammaproteobacteria bacterium]
MEMIARGALHTAPRDLQEFVASLDSRGTSTAIIVFDADGSEEISYTEIAHLARRFGGHLAEHMVENHRVIILPPSSPNHIAAALGAFYAGICVVPLDTQLPENMLRHIVEDSDSSHIITTAVHAERVKKLFPERPLKYFLLDSQPDRATYSLPEAAENDCSPGFVVDENAVAALFYTSGTTGKPKGVPLTHANLIFQITTIGERRLLGPGSRVLLPLPLHHVYPFVLGVLAPLALGATMVLPFALTGPQLSRALIDAEVTHLIGVPRLYEALLSTIWAQLRERNKLAYGAFRAAFALSRWVRLRTGLHIGKQLLWPLHKRIGSKLRVMASGGALLPESLAGELEAFGWKVSIGYGLTETSPLITLTPPGKGKTGSVGKIIDGIELRVAPLAQVPAPEGEIQVRGPGVFRAYYKLPEKTRQAFTKDGWFRTGAQDLLGGFDPYRVY